VTSPIERLNNSVYSDDGKTNLLITVISQHTRNHIFEVLPNDALVRQDVIHPADCFDIHAPDLLLQKYGLKIRD